MLTEQEIQERISNRPKKYWIICDKCGNDQAQNNICKCSVCSSHDKPRMFVHLNEPNPHTVNWKSMDPELKAYTQHGCFDTWQLGDNCSKKYQMYADWTKPHPDLISYNI